MFTVLDGIPPVYQVRTAKDGYVMFIGVVNMMPYKCMINGGTVAPITCLSRPDFLALPLKIGLRGPCSVDFIFSESAPRFVYT